jgi:hypothetical protein
LILRLANPRHLPRDPFLAGQGAVSYFRAARASYFHRKGAFPILQRLWPPTDPLQYAAKRFLAICSDVGINVDLIDSRIRLNERNDLYDFLMAWLTLPGAEEALTSLLRQSV